MATFVSATNTQMDPYPECVAIYNALTAGETVNINHTCGPGTTCQKVEAEVTTAASDGSPIFLVRKATSDVKSISPTLGANTVAVKVDTIPGGSLTGMTVKFRMRFDAMAANAINATPTL
jgi:hypothetical protein